MRAGIDCVGVTIVFFCHDGNGNLLMGKRTANCRDEHGRWDCGGGQLELGAGIQDTLHTEIAQEYGATIRDHSFLGCRGVHRVEQGVRTHWVALDFKVLVDPAKVRNGEPQKFSEVRFFPFDNPPQPAHSQFLRTWSVYRRRFQ